MGTRGTRGQSNRATRPDPKRTTRANTKRKTDAGRKGPAARATAPSARTAPAAPDGDRRRARKGSKQIESRNPATGEVIGAVPVTPPDQVERIAEEVARIQRGWALVPLPERLRMIARAAILLLERGEDLALAVAAESGKTVVESTIVEVSNGAAALDWIARWGARYLTPERIPDPAPLLWKTKRHWVEFHPLGVVGIISPWNYPFVIPLGEVAQALAAGNGVVLKPSEFTPLAGEHLARLFSDAGLPDGVLRVVHGFGETGAALCEASPVRKIFFTGSPETGRKVMQAAARHGKPVMLELGGKDPAVVLADADIDRAVNGILWSGLGNSGQTCAGVERIYVDRRIHDRFVRRLAEEARKVRPGDPSDPETQIGPMNNEPQYRKVLEQLDEATGMGARAECGGRADVDGLPGRFLSPVVLTGVDHSMKVMTDETFGPLLPVMPFDTEEEAVRLANDSRFGLGASVWSRDLRRAGRLARRIDAGMVWVNDHTYSHGFAHTPWGGVKDSGTGVTHSKFGFYEMVEKRLVADDRGLLPDPWWYPFDETKRRGFLAVMRALYGRGSRARTLWERRTDIGAFLRDAIGRGDRSSAS